MANIGFISLGCAKNQVDCERMMYRVQEAGHTVKEDIVGSDVVVINTCGFIDSAKSEAIDYILQTAQLKQEGLVGKILVTGCLSQRYQGDILKELPEVDGILGTGSYTEIVPAIEALLEEKKVEDFGSIDAPEQETGRIVTTPEHYAFIKIAEGCDNRCAYCIIPYLRGRYRSRQMDDILDEVRELVAQGVKEFQVIAQELTYYGIDIDGKRHIAELISKMADIKGVKWIRLHYAYPNQFPMELLDVMRDKPNVCKYLDIALQHISDHMLERMHRNTTKQETMHLIEEMRRRVPDIHIRTTLMVGFPGETEQDFDELKEFVRWAKFERMGAFTYSEENGTYSSEHYEDDVPQEVKNRRLDELMAIQQEVSAEVEARKVGQTLTVVIDRKEGDYYIGRTEFCSPEVDPEVLIPVGEKSLRVGRFYQVNITASEEFDLYGEVV